MLLESYDLVAITETWWDESHAWRVAIDGNQLFRKDRQGRRGRGVALYIKKGIECEELSLKNSHEQVESLWVRIRDRGNKGNLVVGVYYRLTHQGEPIDEAALLPATGGTVLAGSCPAGGLQPLQHLLEK